MKRYKMRAECVNDVGNFLKFIPTGRVVITPCNLEGNWIPDVDVSFTSPWPLADIRRHATIDVQDGHVMAETVALAKDYTGWRQAICYICGERGPVEDDARCEPCVDAAREAIKANLFADE